MEESVTRLWSLRTSTRFSGLSASSLAASLIKYSRWAWISCGVIRRCLMKFLACSRTLSATRNATTTSWCTGRTSSTSSLSRTRSAWLWDHIRTLLTPSTSSQLTNWSRSHLARTIAAQLATMAACCSFKRSWSSHPRSFNQSILALHGNRSVRNPKARTRPCVALQLHLVRGNHQQMQLPNNEN